MVAGTAVGVIVGGTAVATIRVTTIGSSSMVQATNKKIRIIKIRFIFVSFEN
jgi:hypothetical protein